MPVNHPRSCNVVATLDCEVDCWFVIDTVSVPLVLFAIDDVVRLHVYWSLEQAVLHAAKDGVAKPNVNNATIKAGNNFFII